MPGNATLLALPSLLTCVGVGIGARVIGVGIEQTQKVATMAKNANFINEHPGLVLILAGSVCNIFIYFWYISTVS
jgi:hypothetical protein